MTLVSSLEVGALGFLIGLGRGRKEDERRTYLVIWPRPHPKIGPNYLRVRQSVRRSGEQRARPSAGQAVQTHSLLFLSACGSRRLGRPNNTPILARIDSGDSSESPRLMATGIRVPGIWIELMASNGTSEAARCRTHSLAHSVRL